MTRHACQATILEGPEGEVEHIKETIVDVEYELERRYPGDAGTIEVISITDTTFGRRLTSLSKENVQRCIDAASEAEPIDDNPFEEDDDE